MNLFPQVAALQHLAALAVNQLALLVVDVVELKDVFAALEVGALDALLSVFNRAGQDARLDGRVVVHPERVDHPHQPVGAEQAQQVVLQREEEAAFARVALPSGAAAELVVDAAAFVPLGAEDVQTARRLDLFGLVLDLRVELGGERAVVLARGEDFLVGRLVVAGGLENQRFVVALGGHPPFGEVVGVAAELDVGAAAGHIRRDGDRAQLAGLRNDFGLLVVEFGVEDVVLDAALCQQLGNQLGLVDGHRAHQHRLPLFMAGDDLLDDRAVFALGDL